MCMSGKGEKNSIGVPPTELDGGILPEQKKFFSTSGLKGKARAGTQLPDPKQTPEGYHPDSKFKHLFPKIDLPAMFPESDRMSFGSPDLPPHELYFGDNLYVLRQLPNESIDLIYIDPPFFSNRNYVQTWGDDNEVRSFDDIFQDGMYSYLAWLNARLWEMKRVLRETGSIYVHCDWHASHYIKTEMDKIFGYDNFVNEIVWGYTSGGVGSRSFARKHDVILYYGKTNAYLFNKQEYRRYCIRDESGREIGRDPRVQYFRDERGTYRINLQKDWWDDIGIISPNSRTERIGYPTQKPEALLERIIEASSNEGDVVADFFMGGGTTGAVALKLGRRFIGCDSSRVAVSVSMNRLATVGEDISGITVKQKEGDQRLQMKIGDVADLRVGYVGTYPREKFKGISQEEFVDFIRKIYGAGSFTGKAKYIHAVANAKVALSVGPASPEEKVSAKQVKGFVEESLRQYHDSLRKGGERILQIIGWGLEPAAEKWRREVVKKLSRQGLKVQIEFVPLSSEEFRQRIFRNIGESNTDLRFNRLNESLSFSSEPYAGEITVTEQKELKVSFELVKSQVVGSGRLVNCQWDFAYDGQRFAERKYALNTERDDRKIVAKLTVEHIFDRYGEHSIAARVQDSMGGEHVVCAHCGVTENGVTIEAVPCR